MDSTVSRKERKRDIIRRAALELFRKYGFNRVSLGDVARAAGVSQVTIYNHFGSKDQLVRESVRALLTETMEKYRQIIQGNSPFLEKLESIILDKTELVSQFRGELVQTMYRSDPEIRDFVEGVLKTEARQLTAQFFEEGKGLGYINPELSVEGILAYTDILALGLMARPLLASTAEGTTQLMRELISISMYGLMGRNGKK